MESNQYESLNSSTIGEAQNTSNDLNEYDQEYVQTLGSSGSTQILHITNQARLEKWILALKLRYWIDFGNQEQYKVDWLRNLDDKGDLVEIIIKLFNCKDDERSDLLFVVTSCLVTKKITVKGKYCNLWQVNEFGKLKTLVSELCSSDNMSHISVNQMYDKVFHDQDGSNNTLNLEGVYP
jgi:hypothetical protein